MVRICWTARQSNLPMNRIRKLETAREVKLTTPNSNLEDWNHRTLLLQALGIKWIFVSIIAQKPHSSYLPLPLTLTREMSRPYIVQGLNHIPRAEYLTSGPESPPLYFIQFGPEYIAGSGSFLNHGRGIKKNRKKLTGKREDPIRRTLMDHSLMTDGPATS